MQKERDLAEVKQGLDLIVSPLAQQEYPPLRSTAAAAAQPHVQLRSRSRRASCRPNSRSPLDFLVSAGCKRSPKKRGSVSPRRLHELRKGLTPCRKPHAKSQDARMRVRACVRARVCVLDNVARDGAPAFSSSLLLHDHCARPDVAGSCRSHARFSLIIESSGGRAHSALGPHNTPAQHIYGYMSVLRCGGNQRVLGPEDARSEKRNSNYERKIFTTCVLESHWTKVLFRQFRIRFSAHMCLSLSRFRAVLSNRAQRSHVAPACACVL